MKVHRGIFVIMLCFVVFSLHSQIVSIEPSVFTIDDEITITYDATKGNAGLEGESQVYMHTGIITENGGSGNWQNVQGNWGQPDPKVRMTNIGSNKHEITYTPRDFYNISASQNVKQLAFVFRNTDGSKEGKTSTLGDIFVEISDPISFTASFVSPDEQHILLDLNEALNFKVVSSQVADIKLYQNDNLVSENTGNELLFVFNAIASGDYVFRYEVKNSMQTLVSELSVLVDNGAINMANPPLTIEDGLNRINDSTAYIQLYAPNKESVFLISNISNWELKSSYKFNQTDDGQKWWIALTDLDPNLNYAYQFLVDGETKIADPYSELILDPDNDSNISTDLLSVPMEYPRNLTNGHLTYFKTKKEQFIWDNPNVVYPEVEDLVVYEILLRDFLEDHSFNSLIDTLSYLNRLGVNAIELMPISEFENNQSWGYNPSYHMALDKYYGSPESFKRFVDEAHSLGMIVILDIVYNHAFGQSPLVQLYWDKQAGRPVSNGPYFNPTAKHPFNVGFDFNHESEPTKEYVKRTIAYWINEYKVDGFRFDLSKGFTQKQSSDNGVFSSLDQSRIDILKEYGEYIWNINPDQVLILEHFADNEEEKILSDFGFLLWGNANFNFNEATMGYHEAGKSNFEHIYHQNRSWNNPHLIGYMESHDEERLMYKNEKFGNSNGIYDIKNIETGLDRVEMATAFFMSIPGPKMLWQFGELGYGFSINTCEDGTVNDNCRLSPKPIKWDYASNSNRLELFDVTSKMIKLKKTYLPIKKGDVELNLESEVKRIRIAHPDGNLVAIGNFGTEAESILPSFPHAGEWFDYLSDTKIEVTDTNELMSLEAGQYKVFIDDKTMVTSAKEESIVEMEIYPNPTNAILELKTSVVFDKIEIYNMQGIKVYDKEKTQSKLNVSHLPAGKYVLFAISKAHTVQKMFDKL